MKGNHKHKSSKHINLYSPTVESEEAKAERILRKFTRHVELIHGQNTTFLISAKPIGRKRCMECMATRMNLCVNCPVDRAIEETLMGLRALEYVHVKAQIIFPAP